MPHIDFANLAWGWCAITALGNFDPNYGGHLVLWDLGLIIQFPPGSTILIPSALLRHLNIRVRDYEVRYSFTQYSAGGLFRWLRNGCQTNEALRSSASHDEEEWRGEMDERLSQGIAMYSFLDEL